MNLPWWKPSIAEGLPPPRSWKLKGASLTGGRENSLNVHLTIHYTPAFPTMKTSESFLRYPLLASAPVCDQFCPLLFLLFGVCTSCNLNKRMRRASAIATLSSQVVWPLSATNFSKAVYSSCTIPIQITVILFARKLGELVMFRISSHT
jgi:hypothetical protein